MGDQLPVPWLPHFPGVSDAYVQYMLTCCWRVNIDACSMGPAFPYCCRTGLPMLSSHNPQSTAVDLLPEGNSLRGLLDTAQKLPEISTVGTRDLTLGHTIRLQVGRY